jgi:hypothetical protein
VDLGFGDSGRYQAYTRECAKWLGWQYEALAGDSSLVRNFVDGRWNAEDFLVVGPGETLVASNDSLIIKTRK